jgi:hypothetical protein
MDLSRGLGDVYKRQHLLWEQEVAGSTPVIPTIFK